MSGMKIIKNWDYLNEYEEQRDEILKIVDSVFSSGRLILGTEVAGFEQAFASYCGVDFGVGVNSGTDALFLALKAIGIGPGDDVITVSNTAVPTIAAICSTGAMPVFVDVEEDTFLMDISQIEAAITSRARCILPVHLFGQSVDMDPVVNIAKRHDLKIVEDCAQATGAVYKGGKVGSFGDIGAFSFYPTKILGAYGDGGMSVTKDRAVYEKLRRLRFYGMEKEYYSEEEGYNSRLDEVQAALLNFKLKKLDESVFKRQRIAEIYSSELSNVGDIEIPFVRHECTHQFYLYTIKTVSRGALMDYLRDKEIETRITYPTPVHLMKGYSSLDYQKGDLPVTEMLAGRILSLPMHPRLSMSDVEKVISTIRRFYYGRN